MDIDRFLSLVQDPSKSKSDILKMRENALSKKAIQHVHLAERVLDDRFPEWRTVSSRQGGGASPTIAMFKGERRYFDSQKEAYVWLLSRFIHHYPEPFKKLSSETFILGRPARAFYFHRTLDGLFDGDQAKIGDSNTYYRLSNGWYAKLVLSENQKLSILHRYCLLSHLEAGIDWDWNDRYVNEPSIDQLLNITQRSIEVPRRGQL